VASGRQRFFLAERYVPSVGSSSVGSAVRRLHKATGRNARHLVTVLVAEEETSLSVFEAPDPEALETANRRAHFGLDRIVEIELFIPTGLRAEEMKAEPSAAKELKR
jgi:hypothetical protein